MPYSSDWARTLTRRSPMLQLCRNGLGAGEIDPADHSEHPWVCASYLHHLFGVLESVIHLHEHRRTVSVLREGLAGLLGSERAVDRAELGSEPSRWRRQVP